MSKRARITLGPSVEQQPDQVAEAILAAEDEFQPVRGPKGTAPPSSNAVPPTERTLNVGAIVKVVLVGLAVVAAVLVFKGRKP